MFDMVKHTQQIESRKEEGERVKGDDSRETRDGLLKTK
jgi:hypothetical protein